MKPPITIIREGTVEFHEALGSVRVEGWKFNSGGKARSYADLMRAIADHLEANGRAEDAARVRKTVS